MNSDARADFGRGLLLQAIRAEGATMPSGFDREGVAAPGFRNPLAAPRAEGDRARPGPAGRQIAQRTGDPKARTSPPAPRPPLKPSVPQPGTQATPGQKVSPADPIPPVPAYRNQAVLPPEWRDWHKILDGLKDDMGQKSLSKAERFIYGKIYVAEGGAILNRNSGAFGGVAPGTFRAIKEKETSLDSVNRPENLTTEQLAVAYRGYFKAILGSYGGRAALNKLTDQRTAATFSDALFMHGTGDGAEVIKKGLQELMDTLTAEDKRRIGLRPLTRTYGRLDTMHNLQRLDAVGLGPAVRDAITEQRLNLPNLEKGERIRIEHFRFGVKSGP